MAAEVSSLVACLSKTGFFLLHTYLWKEKYLSNSSSELNTVPAFIYI
jgi:hypothetical protein